LAKNRYITNSPRSQFSGILVLQMMYRLCQLLKRMGPDGVLPVLEVSDCALGKSGLAG
jgi:hypothetical protein